MFMVGCTSGHHLGGLAWPPAAPGCPQLSRHSSGPEARREGRGWPRRGCPAGLGRAPPHGLRSWGGGAGQSSLSEAEGGLPTVSFISPLLSSKGGGASRWGRGGRPRPAWAARAPSVPEWPGEEAYIGRRDQCGNHCCMQILVVTTGVLQTQIKKAPEVVSNSLIKLFRS